MILLNCKVLKDLNLSLNKIMYNKKKNNKNKFARLTGFHRILPFSYPIVELVVIAQILDFEKKIKKKFSKRKYRYCQCLPIANSRLLVHFISHFQGLY
jgi:hypothetical protein